jgi:hypothetical protein
MIIFMRSRSMTLLKVAPRTWRVATQGLGITSRLSDAELGTLAMRRPDVTAGRAVGYGVVVG